MLVDLLAILPFYLTAFGVGVDLRFLRAMRLLRVFRMFKLGHYSAAARTFALVLNEDKEKLVVAFSANLILLLVASSTMYIVEHDAQPDAFPSNPETMWWGVIAGLRRGEALALSRPNVDLDRREITVSQAITVDGGQVSRGAPKFGQTRRMAIGERALDALLDEHDAQASARAGAGRVG
jgi:integrase